ncbi:hypothetical protein [Paracoccus sp. Ld10]|uniref:AbiU2 domain-containing protein n=1 Tax=Paracoccus sp. Ld10 TaxID=649158 RepID=UPI00386BC0AE
MKDRPWENLDDLDGTEASEAIAAFCWSRLAILRTQQRIYVGLYSDPERVAVLRNASQTVAGVMDDALFDVIVLGICRLLDPRKAGRTPYRNLTFDLLIASLPPSDRTAAFTFARIRLCERAEVLRDRRDKHLAHTDVDSLRQGSEVGWTSMQDIEIVLQGMGDLLEQIYASEFERHIVTWPADRFHELGFLRALYFGKTAHDERKAAFTKEYMGVPLSRNSRLPDLGTIYPKFLRSPFRSAD